MLIQKGGSGGFKDVYRVLKEDKELCSEQTEDIAKKCDILREYANGRHSSYYNGKATLSTKNLLTVFELADGDQTMHFRQMCF